MQRKRKSLIAAGTLAVFLAAGGTVIAQQDDDPEKAIDYRQALMSSMGGHMSAIALVARGEVTQESSHIARHAEGIAAVAALIPDAFRQEAGPDAGETRAKPEIWQEWEHFEEYAGEVEERAQALAEVAADGGDRAEIGQALGSLGNACGDCHDDFRAERN